MILLYKQNKMKWYLTASKRVRLLERVLQTYYATYTLYNCTHNIHHVLLIFFVAMNKLRTRAERVNFVYILVQKSKATRKF